MFLKFRIYFTVIVTLLIWTILFWNHFHGGVPSHHILANKDLPAISNWWGGLLLPLLTWFLLYRIHVRIKKDDDFEPKKSAYTKNVLYGFGASLFFGILLSVFFSLGFSEICGYMIISLFVIGLYFPIYHAECLLGFVIGMTYTFGAVLPTMIGTLLVLIVAILYLIIRAGILKAFSKFLPGVSSSK